jgi:vacuolar-type H+-ATPase subunit E/Vma4
MSLQNVKEEIVSQASQEAEKVLDQARQDASEVSQKAKLEVSDYKKQAEENFAKMQEATERKMLAAARFDAQRLIMNSKKELVDEVIENVKKNLANLTKTDRKKFLQGLLVKAKKEIDVSVVRVNKNDTSLITGVKTSNTNISGGLIAENKEGTISVDLSVEELLETAKSDLVVELSGVLFGKN